jgi:hypothetical protein
LLESVPGIILACVSLIVMPLPSRAKRKVGGELGSVAMHADATYSSSFVLHGVTMPRLGACALRVGGCRNGSLGYGPGRGARSLHRAGRIEVDRLVISLGSDPDPNAPGVISLP